jgi:putative ABC transport system permease protein
VRRLNNLLPRVRRQKEQDLARELRDHVERRADDLRRCGLTEMEAHRQATIELGGLAQTEEIVRDAWAGQWADTLIRDVRYAARGLLRRPGFTIATTLSLALGVGATTAIFSLTDQLILRPLPVKEPDRLVQLAWVGNSLSASWGGGRLMSYPLCRELQEQKQLFDGVFCRAPANVSVSTAQERQSVRAELVSGSYFEVLGVRPAIGRLLEPSDDLEVDAHPVVVVSQNYWRNQLASAPDVVGRNVWIEGYAMTVIGVAPPGFVGMDPLAPAALWIPAVMTPRVAPLERGWNRVRDRRTAWMHTFGRLKPHATANEVKPALQLWFEGMLQADTQREGFPRVTPERRQAFLASTIDVLPAARGVSNLRPILEHPLQVLMLGTLLLLLLACLNVGGLLLARGAARAGELATRMVMGASRRRLASQLLVESSLITAAGGALGIIVAPTLSGIVLSFLTYADDLGAHLDRAAFLFALLGTAVAAGLCGLAPILQTRRAWLMSSLKEQSRISTARGVRLRRLLIVGQMTVTLLLLVAGGLFVQTLASLHANVGFDARNLLMFSLAPSSAGYSEEEAERTMREVLRRVREVPGVADAAAANTFTLSGGWSTRTLTIQSDHRQVVDRPVPYMRVTPEFFAALGVPVIAGRDFDARDVRLPSSAPRPWRSAIVNESFMRRYFRGHNPVGYRLGVGDGPETVTNIEIIGVVKDFSRRNLRDADIEQVFFPYWDRDADAGAFYVRVRGAPDFAAIRAAVAQVNPSLPVSSLRTYADQIDRATWTERALATLVTGFAVIALLLLVVGLYGLMSFVVTQRRREIGLRLALGSTRRGALWLIVREALAMMSVGTAIALPAAWALRRLIESQLFGIDALDAATIAVATCSLALTALVAAIVPAWRAASTNPMDALRLD